MGDYLGILLGTIWGAFGDPSDPLGGRFDESGGVWRDASFWGPFGDLSGTLESPGRSILWGDPPPAKGMIRAWRGKHGYLSPARGALVSCGPARGASRGVRAQKQANGERAGNAF